ncbi:MAG: gamma-glutamyltransferase [gamma proteobacterium symbiont of Bathyaustriella thionipta]|nr:gamma-glutamyltransferase [gamma proteobacterium symbiont of Bathyaustriella thionipta]
MQKTLSQKHKPARGVIAAGHPATAGAAEAILREGGNAFDTVVAAHFAACVVEPVLCSLAGGGFLMAQAHDGSSEIYDFFTQTPQCKRPVSELDFHPIMADFGTAQQQFHIGLGSVATPGCVAGLFKIHRERCTLPMQRLLEPAVELAHDGVIMNDFQASIFDIVQPIYMATPQARNIYADPLHPGRIINRGQLLKQSQQADFMEALAREGEALFYQGEIAQQMDRISREEGGCLQYSDLSQYRVIKRQPLQLNYREARIFTNPPPSSGGLLIAFALDLLSQTDLSAYRFASKEHLSLLTDVMALTTEARIAQLDGAAHADAAQLLNSGFLQQYRRQIRQRAKSYRGTTHISIIDNAGNMASMTISNGEGCGHLIAGTGIMLNNMLGEEDINPGGFHHWPADTRMTSMMAPTVILLKDGRRIATGSGGSNRIRSALLQVISNLLDFDIPVKEAVAAARLHLEGEHLSIEGGFDTKQVEALQTAYPQHTVWNEANLFFGGVHTVLQDGENYSGAGDARRGGVTEIVH